MKKRSLIWTLLGAFTAVCLGLTEARATVTPYLVSTDGFSNYTVISDSGNTNINGSTINGDVGLIGGKLNSSNNDTINGDVTHTSANFPINSTVTINGSVSAKTSDKVSLTTAETAAALFSKTLAGFTVSSNHVINGDQAGNSISLSAYAAVNVFQLTNNLNGTVTLSGNSKSVFYINVTGAFNINSVVLNGVDAKNVYWNILSGNTVNINGNNGTFYGTILASSSSQATSLNINNVTLEGNIYGGALNLNNVTINGVSVSEALEAPEASTVAALAIFGALILGSTAKRLWNRRHLAAQPEPQAA